eukprot:710850-Prymnesium_polylepis.1
MDGVRERECSSDVVLGYLGLRDEAPQELADSRVVRRVGAGVQVAHADKQVCPTLRGSGQLVVSSRPPLSAPRRVAHDACRARRTLR